jgi:hypothetical protein
LGLVSLAHAACDGQAGNTVFEDNFADDSGGWDIISGSCSRQS